MAVEQENIPVKPEARVITYPHQMTEAGKARYRRKLVINLVGLSGTAVSIIGIAVGYFINEPQIMSGAAVGALASTTATGVMEAASDLLPPRG